MRLLASREHSKAELQRKLAGYGEHEIAQTLDLLVAEGLQSDQRFAETYVQSRVTAGFGSLRILAELREKGVADELARQSLDALDISWEDLLGQVVHKKYGSAAAEDQRELASRARFLAQRGFPESLVRKYLFS